jgi:hypothetical protein
MVSKIKWAIFEWIMLWILILRLVNFFHNSLEQSIQDMKYTIRTLIDEKDSSCNKLSKALANMHLNDIDSVIRTEIQDDTSQDARSCVVELIQLRSFVFSLNKWNLFVYSSSKNANIVKISHDILRKAATPSSAHRCINQTFCMDVERIWAVPLLPSLMASFGFILNDDHFYEVHFDSLILISIVIAASQLMLFIWKSLQTSAFRPVIVFIRVLVSFRFRIWRITLMVASYLSAFVVVPSDEPSSLLMRFLNEINRSNSSGISFRLIWMTYFTFILIYVGSSSYLIRASERRRCAQLDRIEKLVANKWLEQPERLSILSDLTFLEVLKRIDLTNMQPLGKRQLLSMVLSRPTLTYLYYNRGAYSKKDSSIQAQKSRDISVVLSQLGHRNSDRMYPPLVSILSIAIMLSLS